VQNRAGTSYPLPRLIDNTESPRLFVVLDALLSAATRKRVFGNPDGSCVCVERRFTLLDETNGSFHTL
jgi:hypothetical protein